MQGTMLCRSMSLYLLVCANNRVLTIAACLERRILEMYIVMCLYVCGWVGWGEGGLCGIVGYCVGDVVQVGWMMIKDRRKKCGWLGSF